MVKEREKETRRQVNGTRWKVACNLTLQMRF